MGSPTINSRRVDKILSQFSVAYRNQNFIGERILPVIRVKDVSGKFAKYDKGNLRIQTSIDRAPGTRARSFNYGVSQGDYVCTEKALEKLVSDKEVENSDDPYNPKRDAIAFLLDQMWLHQEAALAADMSDTGILTSNATLSSTSQWSDFANSDPLSNFETAQATILGNTGMKPNLAVFGYQAWLKMKSHPDIVDRVKYVGATSGDAVRKAIAELLEVEEILVGDSIKNTANEGQSDSLSHVWGKHAWLIARPSRPGLMQQAFGYTIKDKDRVVDTYRDESLSGEYQRVTDSYDQTLVDVNCAYFIKNAVA